MSWWGRLFGRRRPATWFIGVFVRDDQGNAVAGARVWMKGALPVLTNGVGWAGFENVSSQQNFLQITKDGYQPYQVAFFGDTELSGSQQNLCVGLNGSELDKTLPPLLHIVPLFTIRRGLVRASGRAVLDDDGLFHPVGVTMFWAYQGWTRDRARFKRNIEFLRPYDYDHVRVLCEVGWAGWDIQPSDPDYERTWGELIDYLYDENGLRVELCLMGGDTGHDPMDVCVKIARVINGVGQRAPRTHKVMGLEMTNEGHAELRTQIQMCRYMRAETDVQLIALTSPGDVNALLSAFADAHATEFTLHTDRENADGRGWRQVRQGHDFEQYPGVGNSNEPPGPHSSVSSQTNPRVLAMMRANCILGGAAKFILHIGDMVTGQVNPALGRQANLWDIFNIDQTLKVVRGIDAMLPLGCENWQHTSQHGGTERVGPHPLLADAIWSDGADHGVDRAYGSVGGNSFVEVVNGVLQFANMIALADCQVTATDPAAPFLSIKATLKAGAALILPGDVDAGLAYIVRGQYT